MLGLAIHRLTLNDVHNGTIPGIQSVLENEIRELGNGQSMDISFVDSVSVAAEGYMEMVRGETATLFAAAFRSELSWLPLKTAIQKKRGQALCPGSFSSMINDREIRKVPCQGTSVEEGLSHLPQSYIVSQNG